MYIRRKVFACLTDEMGEEKLFSVNETILSGSDCEDREFSEKEEKKSKIRTAGKVAALTGAGASLAGGITENVIADKVANKVADKVRVLKVGKGLASGFMKPFDQEAANRAAEITGKVLKRNKAFRTATKADQIGAGVALAGTAAYLYGRHKDKKNSKKD